MNNPQLSIIIATFNASKTLNVALDSVLNQTFQDWECIIVDGASTDNTIEIVKSYVDRDSRFRYISEPDKGIYDAFNKGWKMAKGEWIHYLGSDDSLIAEGMDTLIKHSNDVDVIYGNTILLKREKRSFQYSKKNISKILTGPVMCHQSVIVQRKWIERLGGFDERYRLLADYDLMIRLYQNSAIFKYINEFISNFSIAGGSHNNRLLANKERYYIMKRNKTVFSPKLYYLYHYMRITLNYLKHRYIDGL